jgi:alpha-N-arabinofuranosidase
MAWFSAANGGVRVSADSFAEKSGMNTAPCSEGGLCLGWIEDGHWARYENVDFGSGAMRVEIRAASCTGGGSIELRLDKPDGVLLGTCQVADTGDWQAWRSFDATIKPTSGKRTICLVFRSTRRLPPLWFAEVGQDATTIWAQFKNADPNKELVEINVRRTVFYPDKPGRNYITVRGFTMCHAATPWAPPTAEQIGLIGTHWSKGWIIEDNVISHSICSGISLGKHGDEFDNTSANSAEGYVKTIERAHAYPIAWTKENIGHHIVRSNTVSRCEQAGIVGSLGCSFSTVTGNVIHDIHVRRLFTGAEMAGIKFHGAIDTQITGNRIYRTCRGLWLDWMAQGTRVSRNLFYDNADQDLFVEVNHGPFLVDNNLFLSGTSLLDVSEGGAYAHNVIAGRIVAHPELKRDTPFHPAHTTALAGLVNIKGGDNRFYNNILIGGGDSSASTVKPASKKPQHSAYGLWVYDGREFPLQTGGNVYYNGARPYAKEANQIEQVGFDPRVRVVEEGGQVYLHMTLDQAVLKSDTRLVNTERLGKAKISQLPYEHADGSPICVNTDYSGTHRNQSKPTPGPFKNPGTGELKLRVW